MPYPLIHRINKRFFRGRVGSFVAKGFILLKKLLKFAAFPYWFFANAWFCRCRDEISLKFFYRVSKQSVKIILVDWAKYPLYRVKNIGGLELQCGLLRLLENIATHEAGVECSVILVINDASTQQEFAYEGLANKYNFIEKLLFRDNSGMDFGAYDLASLPSGLIP